MSQTYALLAIAFAILYHQSAEAARFASHRSASAARGPAFQALVFFLLCLGCVLASGIA